MRLTFLIFLFFFFASAVVCKAEGKFDRVFKPGEQLFYDVYWFIVPAGKALLGTERVSTTSGENAYHFTALAESWNFFSFKVKDLIEGFATENDLLPIRAEKHLREGNYKKDLAADFDIARGTVRYSDGEEAALAPGSREVFGAFYYFRAMELPLTGQKIVLPVHADKKNYEMEVEVVGHETVSISAGKFNTVRIRPKLIFQGEEKKGGAMEIWLTDDEARIPVKVKMNLRIIGSINIELNRIVRP